jgi:anti-sigma factor RsiW
MDCDRVGDDGLQADKMDLLYGEADTAARARVEAHLAGCAPCREEMGELRRAAGLGRVEAAAAAQ